MPAPESIPVCDEADAVLSAMALHVQLGRGRLLEIAIGRLADAVAAGDPAILAEIAAKKDGRTVPEIAHDAIEADFLAHPPPAVLPY